MKDREISPDGSEFPPGMKLAIRFSIRSIIVGQHMVLRRRSGSELIFVPARQHVLISDISGVRKEYSSLTLCRKKNSSRLRRLFLRNALETDAYLRPTSSRRKRDLSQRAWYDLGHIWPLLF